MFRLSIRGVPDLGHIAYIDVNSFADVHARFSVKITPSFIEPGMAAFKDTEGRKVFLYILPEEHDAETVLDVCGERSLTMRPSRYDDNKIGSCGTGTAALGSGEWKGLDPKRFPDYPAKLREHKDKERAKALKLKEDQDLQDAMQEAMQEALEAAIAAKGWDAVMQTLKRMTKK